MSLFKRMLASVGIGSSQVDTRLESDQLTPGEEVRGVVVIQGGHVEQQVSSIYLQLMTQYIRERDDKKIAETCVIRRFRISEPITVGPGETIQVPFQFPLPPETPTTIGRTPVWLKTSLDIDNALDPTDHDYVQVHPHPSVRTVLEAVHHLGFRLRKTENEYSPTLGRGLPFVQEFEFAPSPAYRGRLDELELVFFPNAHGVDVLIEVDRRARGLFGFLEEAMELDERKQVLRFSSADLARGPAAIASELDRLIAYHAK